MTDRQNRKKRYNIVHLLRKRGIGVDTINHAIQINCGLYEQLDLTGLNRFTQIIFHTNSNPQQ
jgi:hypothetical protein